MMLHPLQADFLTELMNLGMGHAAKCLNELVGAHVRLQVPTVSLLSVGEVQQRLERLNWCEIACVQLSFSGSLNGSVALMFPMETAVRLVTLLAGDHEDFGEMDGLRRATLEEAGNILLNGLVGSISNLLGHRICFSVPYYSESNRVVERFTARCKDSHIFLSSANFQVDHHNMEGDVLLYFEVNSLEVLLEALNAEAASDGVCSVSV